MFDSDSSAEECQTAAVCSAAINRIVSALDVFDVASPVNDCDVQLLIAMHVPIKTLLIDNYDSYTYNLFQLIADVNGGVCSVACASCGAGCETV